MGFAGAGRSEQDDVGRFGEERPRGQVRDGVAFEAGLVIEVEVPSPTRLEAGTGRFFTNVANSPKSGVDSCSATCRSSKMWPAGVVVRPLYVQLMKEGTSPGSM